MLKLLRVSLLAFFVTPAFAQDVSVKKDILYKDGEPYARLKKSGGMTGTYTVSTLDDTEVMVAVFDQAAQRYAVSFIQGGEQTHIPNTIGFGKVLARDIVRADLFKAGAFNAAGVRKFLMAHPSETATAATAGNNGVEESGTDNLVQRNRNLPITVVGKALMQDNKSIGSFKGASTAGNGTVYHTYTFTLPDGKVIAEATLEGVNAKSARVTTLKDHRATTLPVEGYDQAGTAKKIAAYLVERYYL